METELSSSSLNGDECNGVRTPKGPRKGAERPRGQATTYPERGQELSGKRSLDWVIVF